MRGTRQFLFSRLPALNSRSIYRAAIIACVCSSLTGCGETSAPVETAEQEWTPTPTDPSQLPARPRRSSLRNDSEIELVSSQSSVDAGPPKGSAEWLLMEIAHLRNAPVDLVRQPIPGKPGQFQQVRLSPEQAAAEQIRRHEKTVELAMQMISKTHQDAAANQQFNSAVHYLSDARLQLALAGNEEQGHLLDENAEALFTRDPTSFAAIDAASHVVELTHAMADRHAESDPEWAKAYARQARLFAERFPQETSRAAVNLIAAGRLCERLGLDQDAEGCLTVIEQIAPNSPYSEQVAGSLRRLRLPGQPLTDFGGSTFDGGFTSIDRYRGTNLIIAFWASNSAEFRKDLPALQSLVSRSQGGLKVVGVNLDKDEYAVEQFMKETGMNWTSVFYSDPEKRGSRNVIARHYGITNVPEYWLVDAQGTVRSIHLNGSHLEQEVTEALSR
ncbi:thioredoxin-like domain-containing protein [Planctomicrobium sp. SH661]|uniref:TlpA family protein disulfide reductase n=1 Tax=Planctomicrobium sp. SH661 TaxID=3448124 RepID=UPI003F5C8C9E